MKVPASTKDYQKSIGEARELLRRLSKGGKMLNEAINNGEMLMAQQVIRQWFKLAQELYVQLELTTLIHQQQLTGNEVLVRANGKLVKKEEIMGSGEIEVDPWTLLSLEKLKGVFGDDIHNILEIEAHQQ